VRPTRELPSPQRYIRLARSGPLKSKHFIKAITRHACSSNVQADPGGAGPGRASAPVKVARHPREIVNPARCGCAVGDCFRRRAPAPQPQLTDVRLPLDSRRAGRMLEAAAAAGRLLKRVDHRGDRDGHQETAAAATLRSMGLRCTDPVPARRVPTSLVTRVWGSDHAGTCVGM
jgi:hypothetical protein